MHLSSVFWLIPQKKSLICRFYRSFLDFAHFVSGEKNCVTLCIHLQFRACKWENCFIEHTKIIRIAFVTALFVLELGIICPCYTWSKLFSVHTRKHLFPSVHRIYKLLRNTPKYVDKCERSFSMLKLPNNYPRNRISQEFRLHFMLMSSEEENVTAQNIIFLQMKVCWL